MTGATPNEIDPGTAHFINALKVQAAEWGKMRYGYAVLQGDELYRDTLPKSWELA